MRRAGPRLGVLALASATLAPLACSDVTDVELLEIGGAGVIVGQVYLDLDGSGTATTPDRIVPGVLVELIASSGAVVGGVTTDSLGLFVLRDVPVGEYRLALDSMALGDSLQLLNPSTSFSVDPGDTLTRGVGATYPVRTLEDALVGSLGQQVITSGIALNSRLNFGDGQVHFAGGTGFLRALSVDRSGVAAGDSVRIRGRLISDNGRPALRDVTPYILIPQAALVLPIEVSVARAATADGGSLDAAFSRIRDAEITDTTTNAQGHFRFWAIQGSDSVEIVLRSFLGFNTAQFRPDTVVRLDRLAGLLSPFDDGGGDIRWRMLPRTPGDVVLETRTADVFVTASADTTQASLGDTVEVRVVAGNNGPLTAGGARVRDTIPSGLAFVSATATIGSYDSGTGIWDLGDVVPGASDTLWIRMEVTDGTPRNVVNTAASLGLVLEVDPTPGNNSATIVIGIL